jgi:hypothetical protein
MMRIVAACLLLVSAPLLADEVAVPPQSKPVVVHTHRHSQAMRSWGIFLVTIGGAAALIGGIGLGNGICSKSSFISCDPAGFLWPFAAGVAAVAVGIPMIVIGSRREPDAVVSIIPGGAALTVHF